MGRGFDESLEASWGRFEERLVQRLERLAEGDVVVIEMPMCAVHDGESTGSCPYVQFCKEGEVLVAEVVGNTHLACDHALTRTDHQVLRALGWASPRRGRPNWWSEQPDGLAPLVAGMAVGALRQVFGAVSPEFLGGLETGSPAVSPVGDAEPEHAPDPDQLAMAWPCSRDELEELLAGLLREQFAEASDDAERDEDRDFHIDVDAHRVWVQTGEVAPVVSFLAVLTPELPDLARAMIEVNILNRRRPWLRFSLDDRRIIARAEVSAAPLLRHQFCERVGDFEHLFRVVVPDLHERFRLHDDLRRRRKGAA